MQALWITTTAQRTAQFNLNNDCIDFFSTIATCSPRLHCVICLLQRAKESLFSTLPGKLQGKLHNVTPAYGPLSIYGWYGTGNITYGTKTFLNCLDMGPKDSLRTCDAGQPLLVDYFCKF